MAKSQFQTLTLALYDEMRAAEAENLFWRNLFSVEDVANTRKVEIDVMRGERNIAVDVKRGGGLTNRNLASTWSGKEYEVPLYSESSPLNADMLNKRIPGQDPYAPISQMEAMAYWAAKLQAENTAKIMRAENLMGAQACQSGTITLKNTDTIDFAKRSELTVTPGTKWDNSGDPITDFGTLIDRLYQYGRRKPKIAVFGTDAWDSFITNAIVKAYIGDSQYIDAARISPGEIRNGALFQGRIKLKSGPLDLYVDDSYYEESGTPTKYLDKDTVVVMDPDARLVRAYGATEVLEAAREEYDQSGMPPVPQMVPGTYVPWMRTEYPSLLEAGVQSAPILVPVAIDTIGTLSAVNT